MIRRLLQALDPDLLTAAVGAWLAGRTPPGEPAGRRAIAVDGKSLRGSRTAKTAAQHVLAACDQTTGVVLASTDVDGKTNEITHFGPLLDQISDLRDTVITADALPLVDREQHPLGPRRDLRRRPLPDPHRHRPASHGRPTQRRHRSLTTAGITNIAAANRHYARDSNRPPALLGLI